MTPRLGNELLRQASGELHRRGRHRAQRLPQLEVTVHGKSGHGAMPETGRDAFPRRRRHPECVAAVGVPLYADVRLYGEHGVPIVMYGAGPRSLAEANAKRPDENLLLEDLRGARQVVAGPVRDLLAT